MVKYQNQEGPSRKGLKAILKWQFGCKKTEPFLVEEDPNYQPPVQAPNYDQIYNPDQNLIQLTWIGHASFLIQVDGYNILTDPQFSNRASPVDFAGPKRYTEPGLSLFKLPEIHGVLISHNHYDHLDAATIRNLGNQTRYFVPMGLKRWFLKRGMDWIDELNWWQSTKLDGLPIHFVPAKHFSGRNMVNVEATLWGGWVIETSKGPVYFAGDSGYFSGFEEIGAQFAPIRLAMIPIGAYRPRWFMHPIHINPEEAVQVHQDVNARFSVGMHWGTFAMAEEPKQEPPIYLAKAKEEAGLKDDEFVTMAIGETLTIEP